MKRIDSANVALNLFGPGKHGFHGGNPATNTPATFLTEEICNHVQEELAALVEGFGEELDETQRNQIYTILAARFAALQAAVDDGLQLPAGIFIDAAWATPPAGFDVLQCNGQAPSLTAYPRLANIYCGDTNNATAQWGYKCTNPADTNGTRNTAGTHIVLPRANGRFRRTGSDGDGGIDVGRLLWTYQADELRSHSHDVPCNAGSDDGAGAITTGSPNEPINYYTNATGGAETRPFNYACTTWITF